MQDAVGAFAYVRDGIDIIPLICGHYLRIGFSRLVFMDDKSVDGTYEFLEALSRRDARVSVQKVDVPDLPTGMYLKNEVANRMIGEGVNILFPFDQDEFWNLDLDTVRAVCRTAPSGQFAGPFVQFIQDADVAESRLLSTLRPKYRAQELELSSERAVRRGQPFLCYSKEKIGVKVDAPVSFGLGNHRMDIGPDHFFATDLEVFHLPLRSRDEIRKRVQQERFHHKYFLGKNAPEAWDTMWRAGSADADGCLTTESGEKCMLIRDTRLRWVLIRAFVYMALRHPVLLTRAASLARRSAKKGRVQPAAAENPVELRSEG